MSETPPPTRLAFRAGMRYAFQRLMTLASNRELRALPNGPDEWDRLEERLGMTGPTRFDLVAGVEVFGERFHFDDLDEMGGYLRAYPEDMPR